MSGLLAPRLLLLLGECLAASALLPLLALAAAMCFPRRAAMRHLVWLMMFGALLALPQAGMLVPSWFLIAPPAAPAVAVTNIAPVATITDAAPSPMPEAIAVVTPAATPAPRVFDPALLLKAGLALWLAGFLFVLLCRLVAILGLRRLRRASVAHDLPDADCEVRLATTPGTHGPMTWGMLRPVILLPQEALFWPLERLNLVLRHELAHVARHDTLTQTLAQLACALYWPNPLVWLGARALRREAEIAADDAVIAAGIRPSAYAEALLALAAEYRGSHLALAMAAPSALAARVTSVLSPNPSRTGVTKMDAFRIASLSVCALALMALARPDLAVAQAAAPVPPVPSVLAQPPAPPVMPVQPAPATPPSEVRVGPVPVEAEAKARIQAQAARIKAQSDAIKAKGDVLAAKALQKAESEKDPAKRAKDLADAAKVRVQADVVKAQADRLAARAVTLAQNNQKEIAAQVRAQTDVLKAQINRDVARSQRLAANVTLPSGHEATTETETSKTINGLTTTTNSGTNGGAPQNSNSNGDLSSSLTTPGGMRQESDGLHIDLRIAGAAVQPEIRQAVVQAIHQALIEASAKIDAVIAKAQAQRTP